MTDRERVLALFRNSNGILISSSMLIDGQYYGTKRIIEYTGRIKDARNEIGCTCGKDQRLCTAQEHIINVKTNWYRYVSSKTKQSNKPELIKTRPLQGDSKKKWEQIGAYLRGEAPKPVQEYSLTESVQEALL